MIARALALSVFVFSLSLAGCGTAPDPIAEAELEADAALAPVAPSGIIAGLAQPDTPNCPTIEIFEGGAAMRGRSSGQGASGVDYQASVKDVARECRFDGQTMTIRIGVRGRVLLGTSGKAGSYTVPIRVAVRKGQEVIYSNLTRVTTSVGDGIGGAPFQHVEENVAVPQAPDGQDVYEIFVGLDPDGNKVSPRKAKS
jgi:hypothetical protein